MGLGENRDGLGDGVDSELPNIIVIALQSAETLSWHLQLVISFVDLEELTL